MAGSSFFTRLRNGLAKTRESWIGRLQDVFQLRRWDEEALASMEEILLSADVGVKATEKLIEAVRRQASRREKEGADLAACLQREILGLLTAAAQQGVPAAPSGGPWVAIFLGVNGVGKTTTIGKVAARYRKSGKKVLLAAADTFRAAAIEQLEAWGQRVGADVIKHKAGADPSAVVYDALHAAKRREVDVVLIDTAGRLHTKAPLIEELKKIRRVIAREQEGAPHETLLVLDATTGQNALQQARVFKEAMGVTGIVLTKLDGTAKGGVIIAIQEELGVPVRYIGVGEAVEDLQPFDPSDFVKALFEDR